MAGIFSGGAGGGCAGAGGGLADGGGGGGVRGLAGFGGAGAAVPLLLETTRLGRTWRVGLTHQRVSQSQSMSSQAEMNPAPARSANAKRPFRADESRDICIRSKTAISFPLVRRKCQQASACRCICGFSTQNAGATIVFDGGI